MNIQDQQLTSLSLEKELCQQKLNASEQVEKQLRADVNLALQDKHDFELICQDLNNKI